MNRLLGRIFSRRNFRTNFQLTKPQVLFLALSFGLTSLMLARVMREGAAAQGAADTPNLTASAQQQIRALLDEKTRRTPAQQKLDSQLLYAVKMRRGEQIAPGVRQLSVKVETDAEARTVVDITAIVGGTLLEDLELRGAELISVHAPYNSIRVRAPLNRLEEIAALPPVRFIQPKQEPHYLRHVERARENGQLLGAELSPGFPARAHRIRGFLTERLIGGKTSEGDVTHRAAAARTMFGANGAGLRIGVLSDGVASLAASQASGDLPANVTVLPGYAGTGDEGTAMLEIIHDLAPGAQLYFATAQGGIAGFAQAIRDLRAAGCDIIVDDILYAAETPFQDGQSPNILSTTNSGVVWQAVNDVTAAGALYFSAAGNQGNKNDNTSGTWAGDFVDGGSLALVPGGTVHNFGGGAQFDTITATGEAGSLFWADPLGGSSNDYDLFVLNSAGTAIVASSTNLQNGTQDPFEIAGSVNNGNRLVILKKTGAASRFLYLENLGGQLSVNTEGNIRGHACAAAAYGVAATPAAEAGGPSPNPTGPFPNPFSATNTVERFSSDGPRRLFFNANGAAITPGNFSATGGTLRQKPDITAADGVMVTGAGGFPTRFYGTSAAAPHAAAIAAMLKSANPSLTSAQIRTALTGSAIDIEGPGVDRDSGAGILMAFQALQAIGAVPAANLQTGTIAAAETGGNSNTFIEPGENAGLSVQLLNTGPVNATGISAVLATSTPGVVVTAGTSAYPNLTAATGAAVNTTPFAFNLTAAASCPLRIDFTLTVTFTGGGSPRVLPFSVQAGQPPLAITSTLDETAPNSGAGFTATTGLQNLRLSRDGQFTTCNSQKQCPGTFSTGTRRYDAYAFTNCATTPSCITVTLNTACSTADKALFAAAYLGSFDQNNICANYLADPGLSPGTAPVSFSFTVPAGASFTVVVSEINSGASTNCGYTLNLAGLCCQGNGAACPTVSQLAPLTGVPGGNLMVAGANLGSVTSVKFAGDATAAFHAVNSSTLNVVIPNGAANGPLKLSSPGCADAQTANFAYPSNLGTNNEISVDDGTMEVISNFSSTGMSYFVNRLTPTGYPATLTKVAIFFPSSTAAPPSGTPFEVITAANPGGSANIDGIKFTTTSYTTQPGGTFSIFNVRPLTITSGDFVIGFRIPFVSGVFPAAADASSASRGRSYVSDNGSAFFVVARNFGFRAAILQGCPNVTAVSPSSGLAGTQVTLTGTNLNGVSAVKFFNNVTAQFTVNSPTQITVTVPAAAVTGPITLSKPGCPDMTAPVFVVAACPTVAGLNPGSGSPGATVTLTGTNFTGVNAVKFPNNVSAAFTVNSSTQITATIPNGAVSGPITISKPNCPDVLTASFNVIAACPTVAGISPTSGSVGGMVTITGTNFTGVTAVKFANNVSGQFTVGSDGSLTTTIPAGALTGVITISKTGCADVQTPLLTIGPGPSVVTTSGRQLLVRRRNADGTLAAAEPYEIRGVNWSPAGKNTANNLTARRAEFGNWYLQDIPLLKAMNVNTVRLFLDPEMDATGWAVLDELYRNGIMVAMTVDEATNNTARAQAAVNFYKRHPAVLMWMLGNEWNINRYYTPTRPVVEAAQLTQTAAALIKTLDTDHPVASSYGELDINGSGARLADTQNYVNNVCTSVDLWALNIYRGNSFGNLFTQWAALSTKPMFLGEFGTDAFRSFNQNHPPPGLQDGAMQSHWDFCLWNELLGNLAARDATKNALGGCVFEWNDEWWKVSPAGSQQADGFAPSNHPDAFANEEYFGIVDIERQPRPIYALLATMFAPGYQASATIPFRASSRGGGVEEFSSQLGVARFYKCGAYKNFYEKTGGAGGGRGFNVAAINPVTGNVIESRNFDTYGTRNTGEAMRAMIAFLNSQPNGTLLLLAVADEAGLNLDGSCSSWPEPWTEDGLRALESLGSTQIRDYCFRASWAMITVKGQGQARREVLNKTGEASAEVLFDLVNTCPAAGSPNPASGPIGTAVTIAGTNFTGVTSVKFANSVMAQFTVNSAASITATVPAGAVSGPITISKPDCPDVQTTSFTVTCPTITITPATLPDGAVGVAYSQTLTGSGGAAAYNFAVTAGALPNGLTLSASGVLSGAPTGVGGFNFTVTATDANGCTGTRSFTINIAVALGAQTRALYVLNDCNGCPNQIYGYAVNETTGALSLLPGFPVSTGGNGGSGVFSERLTIDRANQRLYAINDSTDTVSAFAINPATGALTALPFSPISLGSGAWNTVAVHPGGSPLIVGDGNSATRKLASFLITPTTANPALGSPFNLGSATAFSSVFSQNGNYLYAGGNAFNNLVAGFSVNATTGVLTALAGSPFNSGATNPLAYATDVSGRLLMANFDAGQVRAFTTLDGVPSGVPGNPFTSGLASANHGVLHPGGFYLVGERNSNVGVYRVNGSGSATTLSAVAGSPFNSGGVETGVLALNQTGAFLFAADGSNRNVKTFSVNSTTGELTLAGALPANSAGAAGRLNGMAYFAPRCETVSLTPATLPNGIIGAAYNQTVSALPAGNYNFTITAGALPAGLSLNAATGAITGTPTTLGTANFTITALSLSSCSGSQAYSLSINNPAPILGGLNPDAVTAGSGSLTLTVAGSNFINGSMVRWNGADRPTTFVSATELTAQIPASDLALATIASVSVFTPAPGGGVSGALSFTVNNPLPALTGSNPVLAVVGGAGFALTVNGANFVNGSVVRWNNSNRATTYVSSAQLTAEITASDIAAAGTANITVFNPAPGGGESNPLSFRIALPEYEADVAPRPNGTGDGTVTTSDWVLAGRFASGLDTPAPGSEFQRADCAPRGSLGDGRLTINDWVQAGRYAAGLDPVVLTGGPAESVSQAFGSGRQELRTTGMAQRGATQVRAAQELLASAGLLAIELDAQGGENALAFSLQFDPAQWRFVSARTGRDAGGAALHINAVESAYGRIGVALAMPAGEALAVGTRQVALLRFAPIAGRRAANVISFADQPLAREVVNVNAEQVAAEYAVRTESVTVSMASIVSAASFLQAELAVESIATAFGVGLASMTETAETLPLPFDLAGTRVTVRDSEGVERPAPLFFVSPTQVNYLIPTGLAEGLATVTITSADGSVSVGAARIASPAPALFAANAGGQGIASAIALRQRADGAQQFEPVSRFDSTVNRVVATPIDPGPEGEQVFLTLFGTGLRQSHAAASARVGGLPAEVTYVGPVSGFAGLDQCNLRLPRGLAGRGEVDVMLTLDGKAANTVKVMIK